MNFPEVLSNSLCTECFFEFRGKKEVSLVFELRTKDEENFGARVDRMGWAKVGRFGVVNFKLQSSLDNYTRSEGSLRWCTNFHQFHVECETGERRSVIKECQYERYPAIITAIANTKYRFTPRRNCFMHFINVITNRPVIIFNRFNWISHGCRVRVRSYFCGMTVQFTEFWWLNRSVKFVCRKIYKDGNRKG